MAKLTLGLMQERTMDALAAHADANTVKAIGEVLNTGGIVAILKVHRQIEEETVRRWIYRDALKKMNIATFMWPSIVLGSGALMQNSCP